MLGFTTMLHSGGGLVLPPYTRLPIMFLILVIIEVVDGFFFNRLINEYLGRYEVNNNILIIYSLLFINILFISLLYVLCLDNES